MPPSWVFSPRVVVLYRTHFWAPSRESEDSGTLVEQPTGTVCPLLDVTSCLYTFLSAPDYSTFKGLLRNAVAPPFRVSDAGLDLGTTRGGD